MKYKKIKFDKWILFCVICFFIISILSIFSAGLIIDKRDLFTKQIMWYCIGFIIILIMMKIKNEIIIKKIWYIYIIGIISLILLILFGKPINNARCWFIIPGIGSFQPSEFVKVILIISLASIINNFHNKNVNPSCKDEFLFIFIIFTIVLIPSFFTFLQPDTGVVLIYLLISIIMLFVSGIRIRWFIIGFLVLFLLLGSVVFIYFLSQDLFIDIFGTSFFLRIDRLLDWSNSTGYQLENGLTAIGSGGFFGYGIGNTPIYFPEPQTDFIFAVFASNFGFFGSILLISLIVFFDIRLIILAKRTTKNINKFIISGILGMLIYQQVQNISMTIGLLPITGITLPFISYGGSSLLSYMIMLGFVFNIANEK